MPKSPKKPKIERLGHYEIVEEIGRGGMAVVYKGIQPSLNRTVAIKVLPASFAQDEEFIARFDREAETIAHLSHPNIIQIIDRGREEGICYFVMEYVDGLNLDEFLKKKSLTFRQTLEIALQICRALAYAHSKAVVHRDLKPSNILIAGDTLAVKVADFGLVQLAQAAGELSTLTQANIAMGTLEYMAPEQRKDARNVDLRADIFSFGIILYEMFTGQLPVGHFKRPSEINTEIPYALDEIILRCLKPTPDERYQSASQVTQALGDLVRENPGMLDKIVRTVKTARERASTAIRKRPQRFIVAGGAVVLACLLLFVVRHCGGGGTGAPSRKPEGPPLAPAPVVAAETATPSPQPVIPTSTPVPAKKIPAPTVAEASPRPSLKQPPTPAQKPIPSGGAEADFKKAETYAAADMKSTNLRQFAVMSMRSVVENYKGSAPQWAEKAQLKIGQIYEQGGEINLALSEYARLLQLFPSGSLRPDAQFRIAECLKPSGFLSGLDFSRKEKASKAIEEYRKVYKEYPSSPNAPQALFEMGLLQQEENTPEDFEAAISSFEAIARDYPTSDKAPHAMLKVAQLCTDKKIRNYEKALETYEQILKRYPDHEEEFHILLNIAAVKESKLKDLNAAIEGYRRVIREKPGTKDALEANRRLESLLQMGQPAR
ncbi:MAG: protein kinase [Candidatus Aureabacteria bacterium]|nr:protein kinase [Candidatus Auribacterota bacterium]